MTDTVKNSSNLYLESGYINVDYLMSLNMPFNIWIGGRGIGKTYGVLKWCRDHDIAPLFLRRTQAQADIVNSKAMSPWKSISRKDKFIINTRKLEGLVETFEEDKDGEYIRPLSYGRALSTFSNVRGFDAVDINYIIIDEFIPENHERSIKNEGDILYNMYETVNRNRELDGEPATRLILMANANRLDSPILMKLGIVNKIEKMIKTKQSLSVMPDRGICIALFHDSPISLKKKNTALYKLTQGSQFEEMSLGNEFSYSDTTNVISKPLNGMIPLFKFNDITCYQDKSTQRFYFSTHSSGTVKEYNATSEEDAKRLRNDKFYILLAVMSNTVDYESYDIKAKVLSIFKLFN